MKKMSLLLALCSICLGQKALSCAVAQPDETPFPTDLTSQSIDEILAADLAGLGLSFVDYRSRLSDVTLGSDGVGPVATMMYTYQLERGQKFELENLHRLNREQVDAMMNKLNEQLPVAVCGEYSASCFGMEPKPTAEFVKAGGKLQLVVTIAGDEHGPEDMISVPLALDAILISTCAAP